MNTYLVSHRGKFCNRNLIDEALHFSEDTDFDSIDHTLVARFEDPPNLYLKIIWRS